MKHVQSSLDLFAADDEAEPATFPAADAVAELREIAASSYDGVDVIAFVRSLRDDDEADPTIEEPEPPRRDRKAQEPRNEPDPTPSTLDRPEPVQRVETWAASLAYYFGGRS